jgi:DNA-directed RNA polymerase subunit beta
MSSTPVTASNLRLRKSFARTKNLIDIPNLIALQKKVLRGFLAKRCGP